MDLAAVRNPCFAVPDRSIRDPALVQVSGAFHLFFTVFEATTQAWHVGTCATLDFVRYTPLQIISPQGYASPGNAIRVGAQWWVCVQSYDLGIAERERGQRYPGDDCRLFWLKSDDLVTWSPPVPLDERGCRSAWASSPRQIDPYVLATERGYYLFYKAAGAIGLWHSEDLETWRDAAPERRLLAKETVPAGVAVENPCVIADGDGYRLYYSPCRPGRGLSEATSTDLREWTTHREIPTRPTWAANGFTAHFVARSERGAGTHLMLFHGEHCDPDRPEADVAALGLAWSDDLATWTFAPPRDEAS